MTSPPSRQPPGIARPTRLGRWEVLAKIAGGGMSALYLGRRVEAVTDPNDPSVVALKIVRRDHRADERVLKMFLEEGKLLERLVHPNIVRTLEVGTTAEQSYIAMELMLGTTLAAMQDACISRDLRLHPDVAAWVAARVAEALHYAHELHDEAGAPLGIIHRDVNPQNIFATFRGEVKLFDFGMAKETAKNPKSAPNVLKGKLPYLSPEQIMQMPLDRRSDVFALGTTLWEFVTARRLFRRDTDPETIRAVRSGPIPDPRSVVPDVPEPLALIAKRALERNREHRYRTAADFAADLDRFLRETGADDVPARLADLVDTLFPGEQKRQTGWLKPAILGGRMPTSPMSARSAPAPAPTPPRAARSTLPDGTPTVPAPPPVHDPTGRRPKT
jgi:eukaryotic-like serine/threonine-protein kinase